MATYGSFPGVKVTTSGGGLTGVTVGAEEKLVLYGPGGSGANASTNVPTQIQSLSDADTKFGDGSPVAEAVKQALANGANRDFLYGVLVDENTVSSENIGNGSTGANNHTDGQKISNLPLLEDPSSITVYDGSSNDLGLTINFVWETNTDDTTTDFSSGSASSGEFDINPLTGEWRDDGTGQDYHIDYSWHDYSTAFDTASDVLDEGETGILATLTESPDVHSALTTTVSNLRTSYQMAQAVAGARPNKTNADGEAVFTSSDYTDTSDDDTLYLVGPSRQDNYTGQRSTEHPETVIGAVAGMMAGHPITDPVYNDAVSGLDNLTQKLTSTDADNLRNEEVIPLRQGGSIRVKGNLSTSTATDWTRDFWRRRIVDRAILVTKQVGDDTIGRINDDQTREDAEDVIFAEFSEMVEDRLLKPNTDDETRWYVEVVEDDTNSDQINIDVGITPQGIAKRIDETITINT